MYLCILYYILMLQHFKIVFTCVYLQSLQLHESLEDKNVMVAFSFSGNPIINLDEEWNRMTEFCSVY